MAFFPLSVLSCPSIVIVFIIKYFFMRRKGKGFSETTGEFLKPDAIVGTQAKRLNALAQFCSPPYKKTIDAFIFVCISYCNGKKFVG